MSWCEIVGVATGILGVWLTTRQKIWCWPVGLISVAAFVLVFFEAKLYGAMGLQVVYIVLLCYGWYAWLPWRSRPRRTDGVAHALEVPASTGHGRTGRQPSLPVSGCCPGRTKSMPMLDASTTSFSLIAQWMQTRKCIENWLVWIVVDVAYVGMTLTQGLNLTAGLYFIYIALAVMGYRDWRRSMA